MVKNSSGLKKIDGWMSRIKEHMRHEMERVRAERLRRMSAATLIRHI